VTAGDTNTAPLEVLLVKEARAQLPEIAHRFLIEGEAAEPVVFGRHRKPEGVFLSIPRYEAILDELDDLMVQFLGRSGPTGLARSSRPDTGASEDGPVGNDGWMIGPGDDAA
jgi:hypothetical protein